MKKSLKSTVNESGTIQSKLSRFLMSYRSIPLTTTEETPAELFLRRPIRTRLDLLKPNLENKVTQKQESRDFMTMVEIRGENLYWDKMCWLRI